jgi:hypothetical protein
MNWLKHLIGPRRRLAGAMVLVSTVALGGSLFAAPASASAEENRRNVTIVRGENVRTVRLGDGRGNLIFRTSGDHRELRGLDFVRGHNRVALLGGGRHIAGLRVGLGHGLWGHRFVLPASTWGLLHPYLGMPFGYPYGYGLGPMSITTGFGYPGLGLGLGGFGGVIGLGDRHWVNFRD